MNALTIDPACDGTDDSQSTLTFSLPPVTLADPPTLLVVDDDPFFRELETRALCNQGYKVLQADGPAEAMRLAGVTPTIDLLLTDFVMPELNGLELARQFRSLHPKAPVLLVSSSLLLVEDKADGLDRFSMLEKSSTFDGLLKKVHALLADVSPLPLRTGSMPAIPRQSPL